jgi:hypothetical protein
MMSWVYKKRNGRGKGGRGDFGWLKHTGVLVCILCFHFVSYRVKSSVMISGSGVWVV